VWARGPALCIAEEDDDDEDEKKRQRRRRGFGGQLSYTFLGLAPVLTQLGGLFRSAYAKDQGSIDGLRLCPVLATPWLTVESRDRALQ